MKKIIGIILLSLLFIAMFVGFLSIFCFAGLHWIISGLITLGIFIAAAIIVGLVELIEWLLT